MRSVGTTLLLNLFIPGAGHVYADGRWKLLGANLTDCFLGGLFAGCIGAPGAALLIAVPVNLVVWIAGLVTSSDVTGQHNAKVLASQYQAEASRRGDEQRQREARERGTKKQARAEARQKTRVSGSDLGQKFARIHALSAAGVLTLEEGAAEKKKLIAGTVSGWTDEDKMEFLAPFADLSTQGVIAAEDLQAVKALYPARSKGQGDGRRF